jgi:putative hydrolase of the HAD superfamily
MKAVLFDFGGTIDTDGVHWSEKFWEHYEQFGVEVTKKAFEEAFVQSESMILDYPDLPKATFYKTLHKQVTLQFAILKLENESALLKKVIDACYEDVRGAIARARKVLDALQPAFALGVVSNFYGNLEVVCREFGLDRSFATMIDSAVVGVRKPDPMIFALALARLGVAPNDAWVVGDSYDRDIVPAKTLGCSTIWLKGKSWREPPSTEAADYTVLTLEDIKKILLS